MKKILLSFLLVFLCSIPLYPVSGGQNRVRYLQDIFTAEECSSESNIVYKTIDEPNHETLSLKLDITRPMKDALKKRPFILWIHGGGFVSGSKEKMTNRCLDFSQLGYVTGTVNYRLIKNLEPDFTMDDVIETAVDDVRSAIDWCIENAAKYGIDETCIFVGGSSAGAITACHVAYDDREWKNKKSIQGIVSLWGGIFPVGETKSQPDSKPGSISYDVKVDAQECSACIIHGAKDPIVPVQFAYTLEKKLTDAGIPCVMKIDPDAGHGVRSDILKSYHSIEPLFFYICMQ